MRRAVIAAFAVGCVTGLSLVPGTGRASLYSPADPFAIPVGDDGKAQPLPFEEFKRRLAVLTNAAVEPKFGEKDNPDRQKFLDRIRAAEKNPRPSNAEAAALAVDLLRVGRSDKALDLLGPRTRRADYFVFTTIGHAHAARGEWADALRYHKEERLDTEMPAAVPGLSKPQRDWWQKLDEEYVTHFYRIRKQEADARRGASPGELDKINETEDVLPLFPLPGPGGGREPVRFVNDAGAYQGGVIAAAEKAKLPPDALAVVQQLVLWFPSETRLYWLLAELYAANGDLTPAVAILDECTWGRQYGNRKVLVAHRQALRAAADARPRVAAPEDAPLVQAEPAPTPTTPAPEPPISMQMVLIYFGAVALIGVLAFVRTMAKRKPGEGCGPVG